MGEMRKKKKNGQRESMALLFSISYPAEHLQRYIF
jgi:hypothetical protein